MRSLSRWWLAAALAVAVQLWGLYRPTAPPTDPAFPELDKVAHVAIFGAPTLLVGVALWRSELITATLRGTLLLTALVFAGHAVLSEIIQGTLYAHRSGDPADVAADVTGIGLGTLVGWLLLRRSDRPPRS